MIVAVGVSACPCLCLSVGTISISKTVFHFEIRFEMLRSSDICSTLKNTFIAYNFS